MAASTARYDRAKCTSEATRATRAATESVLMVEATSMTRRGSGRMARHRHPRCQR